MTRTDIHAPSSPDFDPQAYTCVGVFDMRPEVPMPEQTALRMEIVGGLLDRGFKVGHGGSQNCGHCGASMRYSALMVREDASEFIYVGEDCLDNRFDLTRDEFQTLRTTAMLNRERVAKADKIAAAVEANPVLVWLTYPEALHGGRETTFCTGSVCEWEGYGSCTGHTGYLDFNSFLDSIAEKFRRYVDLSEKQIDAAERAIVRDTERRDRKAARIAAEQAAKAAGEIEALPATAERIKITGEVVSLKTVESQFGTQFKMLVRDDRGFKVYGSEPSSITPEKGSRVTFMAKVERSKDDEFFGFFSRPTKAEIV